MNAKHASASVEHYTPPEIVEAAREVLGVIELDPATSVEANRVVRAIEIMTTSSNGLTRRWRGRVFLNPPGGLCDRDGRRVIRAAKSTSEPGCTISGSCGLTPGHEHRGVESSVGRWWRKLASHWQSYDVEGAIFVGFSIEVLQSTQKNAGAGVLPIELPFCVPGDRLRFLSENAAGDVVPGDAPTHASVIVCLPMRNDPGARRFERVFSKIGAVRL